MTIGIIVASTDPQVPEGWLICDGSSYPNAQYPELSALLGQVYGPGESGVTFQLPDLRSQFIRGLDIVSSGQPATGRDPDVATRTAMVPGTTKDGANIGSLQTASIGPHSHTVSGLNCAEYGCDKNAYLPDNTACPWGATDGPSTLPIDVVPRHTQVLFLIQAA